MQKREEFALPDFVGLIDRMMEVEGSRKKKDIASALGASPSMMAGYHKSGSIPVGRLARYSQKRGISLDWLVFGEGPMRSDYDALAEPEALYEVRTNQDAVYDIAEQLYEVLQAKGATIPPEKFGQIVRYLHRSMLAKGLDAVLYHEVEAVAAIALTEKKEESP